MRYQLIFRVCIVATALGMLADSGRAAKFASNWQGERVWVGPQYWANPLQDWSVRGDTVVAQAKGPGRSLQLLTYQLGDAPAALEMSVRVRFNGPVDSRIGPKSWAGFALGARGELDDYRHAAVYPREFLAAGVRCDGTLVLGQQESKVALPPDAEVLLQASAEPAGDQYRVTLRGQAGGKTAMVACEVPAEQLTGNLALATHTVGAGRETGANVGGEAAWHFRDWRAAGDKLEAHPEQTFGPILWTQYTLSRGMLKLAALMAVVGERDEKDVVLEIRRNGQWQQAATARLDDDARVALFRIEEWDAAEDVPYRVVYHWQGAQHVFDGTIRREPVDKPVVVLGGTGCDNGYVFPQNRLVKNLLVQNPDLLFFYGDQIYERVGGFGITREPVDIATLDYLRKYWLFGWSYRDLMRDRPTVIIPDDHDVFQGNLWGQGGRAIPSFTGRNFEAGGYAMHPRWVNMVQRTQTAHLPDAVDPAPVQQGITVYFTEMLYGGIDFAILEDRKFKTGPGSVLPPGRGKIDPGMFVAEQAELLGARQEAFLRDWAARWAGAHFKVALHQTPLARVTTHTGGGLQRSSFDLDANGWPKAARDRAVDLLRRGHALSIVGDQHLSMLFHYGTDAWQDAGICFLLPASAVGFPRAWWPEVEGEGYQATDPQYTGRFADFAGNRITVYGVGNPERQVRADNPERTAHDKASGHGIVRFHKQTGQITCECWRYLFDASNPQPGDQFPGFPRTFRLEDNYGRQAAGYLPTVEVQGIEHPVFSVIDETNGELLYALRVHGQSFAPKVFADGSYTVRVGEGAEIKELTNLKPGARGASKRMLRFR